MPRSYLFSHGAWDDQATWNDGMWVVMSGEQAPPERTLTVGSEDRTLDIEAEDRTVYISEA